MNIFPTVRALQFAVFCGFFGCFLSGATQKVAANPIVQPISQPTASARFPFVMPWDDATKTAIDVSFLNPAPLTNQHRVLVKGEHFADTTGRRVRFLGTNFAAGANFLSKSDAEKVAARLHKLGFNIIRLHHMDASWAEPNIFGSKRDGANLPNEIVAPASLDALDYLVFQLKKNGIYVDLNLHVMWMPNAASGYPDIEKVVEPGKALTYFEKKAIAHQREYARQFLTHVDPYTKLKWSDDPAVALIEITNEDSLLAAAWDGRVANYPPYYRDQLAARWNAFLKTKYGTTAKIKNLRRKQRSI